MKTSATPLKDLAVSLRRNGKTYAEICAITGVKIPKGTLSYWCKNISLTQAQTEQRAKKAVLDLKEARKLALITNKQRRSVYISNIIKQNRHLTKTLYTADTAKIALVILYICEGSKNRRGALVFGNSDPNVIRMFLRLLRQCYPVDEQKFRCTVQCRADQNAQELELFWSKTTCIPLPQFYKAQIDPRTKGKRTKKLAYKGVCRIDYFSGHVFTELREIGTMLLAGTHDTHDPVVRKKSK